MSSEADHQAVLDVEAAYDSAWSSGDLDAILVCFAEDAVLVNPRGEVATGAVEIRERLGTFLLGPARGSDHRSTITRVSFVTADVAVVDGEARLAGPALDPLVHRFTDVLVRRDDRWSIAHVRAYDLVAEG